MDLLLDVIDMFQVSPDIEIQIDILQDELAFQRHLYHSVIK